MNLRFVAPIVLVFSFLFFIISVNAGPEGFTQVDVASGCSESGCDLTGQVWKIQWTDAPFDASYIYASLTPNDMQQLTGGDHVSEETFELTVTATDDGCYYNINRLGFESSIYTIDAHSADFYLGVGREAWIEENCDGLTNIHSIGPLYDRVLCVSQNENLGHPGEITSPNYEFSTDWTINVGNKPQLTGSICTGIHSNSETCSGIETKLGNYAYIKWLGNLGTGYTCQDSNGVKAVQSNSFETGWRVVDEDTLSNYYSYNDIYDPQSGVNQNLEDWFLGQLTETQVESLSNSKAYAAIGWDSEGAFVDQWAGNPLIEQYDANSGVIRWQPSDQRLLFPRFDIYIDGDYYLTLVEPCGEADIVSASVNDIQEDDNEQVSVSVKNTGNAAGGFNLRLFDCSQYFTPISNNIGVTLNPDETRSINDLVLKFSYAGLEPTVSGTCKLEMTSIGYGCESRDVVTLDVRGVQAQDCSPLTKACAIDETTGSWIVKQCNSFGTGYDILKTCGDEQKCEGGICISGGDCNECASDTDCDDGDSLTSDVCRKNALGCLSCYNFDKNCNYGTDQDYCEGLLVKTCTASNNWDTKENCNDGNPFTTDSCENAACGHSGFDWIIWLLAGIAVMVIVALIYKKVR